jgi:polysaccharide biosynthesis/export protein
MRYLTLTVIVLVVFVFSTGCSKKNILFQSGLIKEESAINTGLKAEDYPYHQFKVNDIIQIKFLNSYNFPTTIKSDGTDAHQDSFVVMEDGTIILPILGKTNVSGLTRLQLVDTLTILYKEHISDPIIDVVEVGLNAQILGEVIRPGNYSIVSGKTYLTDIIALSGGFNFFANISDILIIRQTENGNMDFEVDLSDIRNYHKPELLMRDGDMIYVRPVKTKNVTENARTYFWFTSIASVLLSVYIVLDRNR